MSELARELRAQAAIHWRAGDVQQASRYHTHALVIEAGMAGRFDGPWIDWPSAQSIDDCTEVYPDPIDTLDDDNACTDPGDHLWLTDMTGETRCVHCGAPAMPIYATREAK